MFGNLTVSFQTGRNQMYDSHASYHCFTIDRCDSQLLSSNKTDQIKLRCGSSLIIQQDCGTPCDSPLFIVAVICKVQVNISICENITDKERPCHKAVEQLRTQRASLLPTEELSLWDVRVSQSKRTAVSSDQAIVTPPLRAGDEIK